jgi:hypothetical protein
MPLSDHGPRVRCRQSASSAAAHQDWGLSPHSGAPTAAINVPISFVSGPAMARRKIQELLDELNSILGSTATFAGLQLPVSGSGH